jgi:UDP-glucose 4-epimerase
MSAGVLITGGLGYAGGRLAKCLAAHYPVTISTRRIASAELIGLHGGVSQTEHALLLTPGGFPKNIHTVLHMAALNEHDCVTHPSEAIRVNIDETRIILENAIAAGVQRFVYFSTAHIYGSPLQGVITENSLPAPMHPYAITHKAAEDYVLAAAKKMQVAVLRLSNSFGAPVHAGVNRWTLLVNDLCRQAIEKNELRLYSNGCQYRDFICLTDVEQAVLQMLQQPLKHTVYNLGSGTSMQVKQMAAHIAAAYGLLTGKAINLVFPDGAVATEEPPLDFRIDRLQREGITLKNDVVAELRQFLVFCQQNF